MSSSRQRVLLASLAAMALLVVLLLARHRGAETATAAQSPQSRISDRGVSFASSRTPTDNPEETVADLPVSPSDVGIAVKMIDEIVIDKTDVCENEPITIAVKAHNPNGAEEDVKIHAAVPDGAYGNPLVVKLGSSELHEIPIVTYNSLKQWDERIVKVNVRRCGTSYEYLDLDVAPLAPERFHIVARPNLATKAEPVRYRWRLGDGTEVETTKPAYEHSYSDRPQAGVISTFVVEVDAVLADGRIIRGKTGIALDNTYVTNKLAGELTPLVEVGATAHTGGVHRTPVTIRHFEPSALALERGVVTISPCDGEMQSTEYAVTPDELLGGAALATWWHGNIDIPEAWVPPGTCSAIVRLLGRSRDGLPVDFTFGLSVGDPPPERFLSADSVETAEDAIALRRIQQAFTILGRGEGDRVTDEELERLVREGRIE